MNEDEWLKAIGLDIKNYRLRKNLDQRVVADEAGVALSALKNLENGKNATLRTMLRVLNVLGRHKIIRVGTEDAPVRQRASKKKHHDEAIERLKSQLDKAQAEKTDAQIQHAALRATITEVEKERGITIVDQDFMMNAFNRVLINFRDPEPGELEEE